MSRIPSNSELIGRLERWDDDKIVRTKERIDKTSEVFTPTELVSNICDELPKDNFTDLSKTFLDPSCGNGQFLSEVLIRKLRSGIALDTALQTIYGIDIMLDNVDVCRERLLCGVEEYRHIVERNIICADALTFNYETWDDNNN